jgi:hypothetical protein
MATLLPSLSSDEEDNVKAQEDDQVSDDEVNENFEFGGILVSTRTLDENRCSQPPNSQSCTLREKTVELRIGWHREVVVDGRIKLP